MNDFDVGNKLVKDKHIKEKRKREVYDQLRRRKAFFYNTMMGGAITIVVTLLISMIYFLIDMIKEASG